MTKADLPVEFPTDFAPVVRMHFDPHTDCLIMTGESGDVKLGIGMNDKSMLENTPAGMMRTVALAHHSLLVALWNAVKPQPEVHPVLAAISTIHNLRDRRP